VAKDDEDPAGPSGGRWAAEEDTAMWDDSAMQNAGFGELAKDRVAKPREESGPATQKSFGGEDAAKIKVSGELTGGHKAQPKPAAAPAGPSMLSWVLTIALALGIGIAVFFVVRALK
jgi:hypothetical protein